MFNLNSEYYPKAAWVLYLVLPFLFISTEFTNAQSFSKRIELEQELSQLIENGYLDAKLNSSDSLILIIGSQYLINSVYFNNDLGLLKLMSEQVIGEPFSQKNRIDFIESLKLELKREGYFKASIQIDSISINRIDKNIALFVSVFNAQVEPITSIHFEGNARNSDAYLVKLAGLKIPITLNFSQLERAKIRLERSRLFSSVSDGEVQQVDSSIQLKFKVKEQNPNRFDIVVGYIPRQAGGGDIIGSLELDLLNSFTEGNQVALNYNRIQPLRTRINVLVKQRYVFDSPFSLGFQFDVYQRDSTFQTQNWNLFSDYELGPYSLITGFIRQEETGNGFISGNVTNGSVLYYGSSFEWDIRNDVYVPTKGFYAKLKTEFGTKENQIDSDSSVFKRRESKKLFSMTGESYHTFFGRHVLVLNGFGSILLSDYYQDSDLFRFGGSESFRGYNEEQFAASKLAWLNAEYRFLLDRTSYLFGFHTRGWFEFPELKTDNGTQLGFKQWIQSYGLGLAYRTRLGLLTFTYAKSPEDAFDNAKIHFSIRGSL